MYPLLINDGVRQYRGYPEARDRLSRLEQTIATMRVELKERDDRILAMSLKPEAPPAVQAPFDRRITVDNPDAKGREAYAIIKLGKCAAELGIQVVPPEMKEKLGKDLASLVEREMSQVFDKM